MDFDASPVLVFWESTRACLLACRHCRAAAMAEPLPGELTHDEARAFLKQLPGFGRRPPVLILTGGDPMLRSDLLELAEEARSLGIPIGLSPAATPLLSAATLAGLRALGVRSVSISLDGATPSTHEGVRGVDNHFEVTRETLSRLVQAGFTVQVNTTVMRDNVEELADIAKLLIDLGVHVWEVFFLVQVGRGEDVKELLPDECEDVAHFLYDASCYGLLVRTVEGPFFRRVAAWRRQSPEADPATTWNLGPLYSRLTERLAATAGDPQSPPHAHTVGTRDGKGIIFVGHDGEVFPAGFLPVSLGNVRDGNLVDIYREHPLLLAIRRAEFSGRCGVCEYKDLCGGSRARAFAAFGDPLAEDPACAYLPPAWKPTEASVTAPA